MIMFRPMGKRKYGMSFSIATLASMTVAYVLTVLGYLVYGTLNNNVFIDLNLMRALDAFTIITCQGGCVIITLLDES